LLQFNIPKVGPGNPFPDKKDVTHHSIDLTPGNKNFSQRAMNKSFSIAIFTRQPGAAFT
jgi:hypothetical protein